MKLNQIVFPLVLALVATLTTTGCKKNQPSLTKLPGTAPVVGGERDPNTYPPGNRIDDGGPGPGSKTGNETANLKYFEDMIMDTAALAAYTIHFGFDSAAIKKTEQASLAAVASALKGNPSDKLLIEGNCDERGTEEYNRALGERRALAAREALVKLGVSPDRIRTISYGKDKPVDPSHTEGAWSKNRRADFVLLHPKMGA
jgi:peptidoglycan-associated lipoprotein